MSTINTAAVSETTPTVEAVTPEATPAATTPALPAWRTLASGQVLKDRDVLAYCAIRPGVTAVRSRKWNDKNTQVHADGSACFKTEVKTEARDLAWLQAEFAREVAIQQAGQDRSRYFCVRCVIEFKGAPVAPKVTEVTEVAEVTAEVPAEIVEQAPAEVVDESTDEAAVEAAIAQEQAAKPAPRKRAPRKVAATAK
jgi:hypothetical protein